MPSRSPSLSPPQRGRRLEHVDAMRPFAQAAVIATHALIFFSPLTTSAVASDALTLTRFSRESFFFISALVLTVTYAAAPHFRYGHFWRRRLVLTGLPYLTWTVIYYVFVHLAPTTAFPYYRAPWGYLVSGSGLHDLATLLGTGYYQLYFIVVLFEFYVVFPPLLALLRRARRWHAPILLAAFAWQVVYDEALRHHWLPFAVGGKLESRLILTYPVYLLGGMVVGLNYRAAHTWIVRHALLIVTSTVALAALAVALNALGTRFLSGELAPEGDVLAPVALAFNVAAILLLYLFGAFLVRRGRSTRAAVASAAEASYGIYLSQMIWITLLVRVAARYHDFGRLAWPLLCGIVVVVVFSLGYALSVVAERTPLGPPLVGRRRLPWHARGTAASDAG